MTTDEQRWESGLPPEDFYPDMIHDYEARPTLMGWVYRKRTPEEAAAHAHSARDAT